MVGFMLLCSMFFALCQSQDIIGLYTRDSLWSLNNKYQCFPRRHQVNTLKFTVSADKDVKIRLSTSCGESNDSPYYEIVLGDNQNSESYIRKHRFGRKVFQRNSTILTPKKMGIIWVKLVEAQGKIQVGEGDVNNIPFMDYVDDNYQQTIYFSVSSTGAAEWKFNRNQVADCAGCKGTRNIEITTLDLMYGYQTFPLTKDDMELSVMAKGDDEVKIVFSNSETLSRNSYCELVLGAENNTKSIIRKDQTTNVTVATGSIITPYEYLNLKINIVRSQGKISIRKGDSTRPFIVYTDPDCASKTVFGIASTNVEAVWQINPGWLNAWQGCWNI